MVEGTVVNGVIVLDNGELLPEGVRVQVEIADPDKLAPPLEPYDREKELAVLRASIEEAKAGYTRPIREIMAEIATRYGLSE